MLLVFLSNLGMGGSASTIVAVEPNQKFRIEFAAEPRNIEIAYEDRTVRFPPVSRNTKL